MPTRREESKPTMMRREEPQTAPGGRDAFGAAADSGSGDDERILLLAGHDPQMSRLARYLTGLDIHFGKGAIVCLQLAEDAADGAGPRARLEAVQAALSGAADLQWFVQGAATARWKTLVDLEQILARRCARVVKYCDRFRDGAADVETVHDLRVSIRTLRSLLTFLEPFQKKSQNRRLQRALREIVLELSRLREYDVLIEETAKVDIDLAPAGDGLVPPQKLDAALAALRSREYSRASRVFSRRRFADQLRMIEKEINHIAWRGSIAREGLQVEALRQRLEDMRSEFFRRCGDLDFRDVEATHKVRKEAKKVRYAANGMKSLLGEEQETVAAMKRVQDRLGRLCDARVNAELLHDLVRTEEDFSEIARWQAENLIALERNAEQSMVEELAAEGNR